MPKRSTPIRAKSFHAWFKSNLRDRAQDIASHGADCGYPWITYIADMVRLFDKFGDEIWEMARQDAEDFGAKNVAEFISGFRRADMLETLDGSKALLVWYACEKLAAEFCPD